MKDVNATLGIIMRGMFMGMAEVVPGVSGGTIALITGIYERLIGAIKSVDLTVVRSILRGRLMDAFNHVDGGFLVRLMIGMVLGIGISIFSVTAMLEHYPPIIWGFFFGLIIASAIYVLRQIDKWDVLAVVAVIVGAAIALSIVLMTPTEGSTSGWYLFISGAIAISALLLPGVSGSFILLLLGSYKYVTNTVKELITDPSWEGIQTMIFFGTGCAIGLITFSRILSWTFTHYRRPTLALLSGFMIGSLYKIWPWRLPTSWITEDGMYQEGGSTSLHDVDWEAAKLISETNVMPAAYGSNIGDPHTLLTLTAIIVGVLVIFLPEMIIRKST